MIFSYIFNCKPSQLENTNDVYSDEFTERQILICLLKVSDCFGNTPIQRLVQFKFTNGSELNATQIG
ncbi:concanavalin A-like lectin/glucanases family protein [Leptospira ellinghausenii]|uniref:Concanavalin A-like lectin/glucanases family protein n=1 Tax=Leptospira ellinghausenii TaxID=1917822 RepID=A0A2P2DEI5_9LEPT|nr:concanavalin A-like lectin/glucanases family protein [Leptospira ellinghausenii]